MVEAGGKIGHVETFILGWVLHIDASELLGVRFWPAY
jgi:hypothetical protein